MKVSMLWTKTIGYDKIKLWFDSRNIVYNWGISRKSECTLCCYGRFPTPHLYVTNIDYNTNIGGIICACNVHGVLLSIVCLRYYIKYPWPIHLDQVCCTSISTTIWHIIPSLSIVKAEGGSCDVSCVLNYYMSCV